MAQPPPVDIFSADIDNKVLVANAAQSKLGGKKIPITAGRRQKWETFQTELKKKNKGFIQVAQKKEERVQIQKNNWQPVPAVGGPETATQQEKPAAVKFEIDRSNLKVVEGTPGSIQLNMDKSKKVTVAQKPTTSNPQEKKDPNPEPANQQQSSKEQNKLQTSGVKGRMTASAFMNIDQVNTQKPQPKPSRQPTTYSNVASLNLNKYIPGYPKGIPKSFLTPQHQQQIETTPQSSSAQYANQQTAPPSSQGPVWEALPSKPSPEPNWSSNKSRFDQLPTGQYVNEVLEPSSQSYAPDGQGFGQSNQNEQDQPESSTYGQPMLVNTESNYEEPIQQYSPTEAYADAGIPELYGEMLDQSPDSQQSGSKRLSAFQRLGPVTQPKKPKLTINLMVGKEQAVREVVDESEEPENDKYTPVPDRPDIQTSLDDTVMKYLSFWPWKKPISSRRIITARESKTIMQSELDQMEEHYDKDKNFFEIKVTGYPPSWNKEDVLDAVLESVKGKSLIPCFIEFTKTECKFLVIRSRPALIAIHKNGFIYRKGDVELKLAILHVYLTVNQIDFIPRLILRKRLSTSMEGETELNLNNFTLGYDISHFLYFPLHRVSNQHELMQLQSSVPWQTLTKLVLSHNKIATLSGFELAIHTPKLKHLDLSYNLLEGVTALLNIRDLPLSSIVLEGNPICLNYIEHERYTKALKMMFPVLKEIDGVRLPVPGEFPPYRRNYAPPGGHAAEIASKVLETLFPLLDAGADDRQLLEDLYMDDAVMTITFMYKLRYSALYKDYRTLFARARILDENEMDKIEGAAEIARVIHRWPKLEHDPFSFHVDVMYHTDKTTILRVSGILKVTTETLSEDEHLLSFGRTLVVHTLDSHEYKITNEMIYWDLPDRERASDAFRVTTVRSKNLSLKLDGPPDAELREKLLQIFMKITSLERKPSERCLESKEWHLKHALEYFTKLLKLDNLDAFYD